VKEKEFLNIYWLEVLKCWKVLEEDIMEKRKKEGDHYMENFELLKIFRWFGGCGISIGVGHKNLPDKV
jgi:hypothetical protein